MAITGRRECRSSNNDVSLPLKSYADLPAPPDAMLILPGLTLA